MSSGCENLWAQWLPLVPRHFHGRCVELPGLQKGDGVIIYAEGKELPLAVGFMTMSSKDIRKKNKGTGIEVCHFLGDGLWGTDEIQ